jgi:hypothetical protein
MALTTEIKYGNKLLIEVPTEDGMERVVIEPIRKSGRSVRIRVEARKEIILTRI